MTSTSDDDPLVLEIRGLRDDVRHLAETNTWRRIGRIVVAVGLVVILGLCVSNIILYRQIRDTANCRVSLAVARADALDDWIRIFPSTQPKTPAEQAALQRLSNARRLAYLQVSDEYTAAVKHSC